MAFIRRVNRKPTPSQKDDESLVPIILGATIGGIFLLTKQSTPSGNQGVVSAANLSWS